MFNDVIEANDGGFLAVGYTDDSDSDIYIVKTNSSGTIEWEHQMGSLYKTGENESAYGVIQESNGDFVVTGQARGYVSGGIDGVPGGPGDSVFLTKIDQAGNILWEVNDDNNYEHILKCFRNPYLTHSQPPAAKVRDRGTYLEGGIDGRRSPADHSAEAGHLCGFAPQRRCCNGGAV